MAWPKRPAKYLALLREGSACSAAAPTAAAHFAATLTAAAHFAATAAHAAAPAANQESAAASAYQESAAAANLESAAPTPTFASPNCATIALDARPTTPVTTKFETASNYTDYSALQLL